MLSSPACAKSNITVIALGLEKSESRCEKFASLPAKQKILILAWHIKKICNELKTKEPDSMWVIAWREYGISEGLDKKGLSPDIKKLLKSEMSSITKTYPNLTIIAGTVSTKSSIPHAKNKEKLSRIIQYYKNYEWVEEEDDTGYFATEHEQVKNVLQINKPGLEVIRNTCYVFNQGEQIWCHDKITPIREKININSEQAFVNANTLFQPGSKKNINNSSIFTVLHPITHAPVKIGMEICLEHQFSILKNSSKEKPLLHFIISDTIKLCSQFLHGHYVMQLDRSYASRLMSTNAAENPFTINSYQAYITLNNYELLGPLPIDEVFVLRVLDKLEKAAIAFPDHQSVLNTQRGNFLIQVNKLDLFNNSIDRFYDEVVKIMEVLRSQAKSMPTLFSSSSLESLVNELSALLAQQKEQHPHFMEYRSKSIAKPLAAL